MRISHIRIETVAPELHVSQQDVLEAFEKIQGTKWNIKHPNSENLSSNGKRMQEAGDPWFTTEFTRAGAFGKQNLGDNRPWGLRDEKLGLKGRSLEQVLKEVLNRTQETDSTQ